MSAMPDNVLPFELPKKPRLKLQEPLPDQRKIVVLPFKAVFDKELGAAGVAVLAGLCAYCNRAGITWVGKYLVEKQPDVIVQIGDFADMPSLSSYDVGKKSFEGRRYKTDIEVTNKAMQMLLAPIKEYNERARRNKDRQYRPRMVLN